MASRITAFFFLLLLLCAAPLRAGVAVTLYSHDFGSNFPHAFFVAKGKLDDGTTIDQSYGFTAVTVSPAILLGSVAGKIEHAKPSYIAASDPQFTITVDDKGYQRLMAVVEKWRKAGPKSYNLGKANCVHFISEVVATLGYRFNAKTRFWKKPKSFLLEVLSLNPALK